MNCNIDDLLNLENDSTLIDEQCNLNATIEHSLSYENLQTIDLCKFYQIFIITPACY